MHDRLFFASNALVRMLLHVHTQFVFTQLHVCCLLCRQQSSHEGHMKEVLRRNSEEVNSMKQHHDSIRQVREILTNRTVYREMAGLLCCCCSSLTEMHKPLLWSRCTHCMAM